MTQDGKPSRKRVAIAAGGTVAAIAVAGAIAAQVAYSPQQPPAPRSYSGARAPFMEAGAPGEWRSQARDYSNTRFSPLNQVNTHNVQRLRVAWTFSDGTLYGHEGAPLVVGSTMYLVSPFPDIAYALDLTKPGAPIKWKYDPKPSPMAIGKSCCDAVLRGWAYGDGKLIYNLLDDHVVALDAATGHEIWRTKMDNVEHGVTMPMSAFVAGDKVIVGNSGGEMGVNGWVAALDIHSGKELWRSHSVGPDRDVGIGANFKPFYAWMRGKDLGVRSWPAGMWKTGAGAVWGFISYDPTTNTLFHGTSNPGPRVPMQRPGDNLWTSSVFARDANTGLAKWAYQFTPHDQWDYDGVNESVLLDMPIKGRMRQTLVHFDRNTYAYTIDRNTGEVLVASPFAYQNWSKGFDWKTGRPIVDPAMQPKPGIQLQRVCPPDIGQKDWEPPAFHPGTGLLYVGIFNICMDLTDHPSAYIPGTPYDGMEMKRYPADGPNGHWGGFIAWDPAHGRKVWEIPEKFMVMSGAIATAGDLVFYGTADGWFRAVNAWTGKVLWSQKLGSGIIAQPIAFQGPDGREYIAVESGVGGAAMVSASMPGFPPRGGTLYVFSLDGASVGSDSVKPETIASASADSPDHSRTGRR